MKTEMRYTQYVLVVKDGRGYTEEGQYLYETGEDWHLTHYGTTGSLRLALKFGTAAEGDFFRQSMADIDRRYLGAVPIQTTIRRL